MLKLLDLSVYFLYKKGVTYDPSSLQSQYQNHQRKKKSPMKPLQKQGFTLIEVMVVIAIIAIIAGIAIPNFISWLPRQRLNSAAQDVYSALIKARSSAIKEGTMNTTVVFGPNAANNGFFAFVNDGAGGPIDPDGVPANSKNLTQEGAELTVVEVPLPNDVAITASFQTVFDRRGFPSAPGTITLRNPNGRTATINLLLTGSAQLQLPTN
jgi:prepilin-type N-terminal cleavage/methylation domain-containing protein